MVWKMRAKLFYSMLNESYRLDAQQKIDLLNIVTLNKADEQGRSEIYHMYQVRAEDLLLEDILPSDEGGWGGLEKELN